MKHRLGRSAIVLSITLVVLAFCCSSTRAQVEPPRPLAVYVNPAQALNFGAFYATTGGSVIISPTGSRSSTGDVVLINLGFTVSPALFEVEALPGTVVSILNGPDVTLTGSNGGSMTLHVGASNPSSPFITSSTPPSRTVVNVGGTLTVGTPAANPPGSYSGSINITFIEQ